MDEESYIAEKETQLNRLTHIPYIAQAAESDVIFQVANFMVHVTGP